MWSFVLLPRFIVSPGSNVALAVKRLHDFGKPEPAALVLFVPASSCFIVLCLVKGNAGPNRYGTRTNAPA